MNLNITLNSIYETNPHIRRTKLDALLILCYRITTVPPFLTGSESHREHPLPDPGVKVCAGEGVEDKHPLVRHTHGPSRLPGPAHFQP